MPTPNDFAAILKINRERRENGTVYSVGDRADTTIGATINDTSRERLEDLRRALLADAEQTFGDAFNEAEVAATYQSLLEVTEGLELGDVSTYAVKFDGRGDSASEGSDKSEPSQHSGNGNRSVDADKYVVQVFREDDVVTGMIAGPVPYAHGNAIYVSRSPKSSAAEGLVIGAKAGQVTRTQFYDDTGSLRVHHVGSPDAVRARVVRLLDMDPEAFEAERQIRLSRAIGARSSKSDSSL